MFARWGSWFLVNFLSTGRERIFIDVPFDYRMLAFTAGVALLMGLMFGLAPTLQVTQVDLNAVLKERTSGRQRNRFGKSVVVVQVALSLLLLVSACGSLNPLQPENDRSRLQIGRNPDNAHQSAKQRGSGRQAGNVLD